MLGTRGVSGRMFVAAAVVGAAAGLAPGMATIYSTASFSVSVPSLLSEEAEEHMPIREVETPRPINKPQALGKPASRAAEQTRLKALVAETDPPMRSRLVRLL